jgi:hypothetical protein
MSNLIITRNSDRKFNFSNPCSLKVFIISILMLFLVLSSNAQIQKGLRIDGEYDNDLSGFAVSMPDANTVAIGAYYNAKSAGHVRIYNWTNSKWVQKGLDIEGESADDWSGVSVSMPDANTVAIGAPLNDGNGNVSGHVRIYYWNGTLWTQKGIDIDGESYGDFSGYSVSMPDANTIGIGAYGNNTGTGNARIYKWNGSKWIQKGLDIDGEKFNDHSGHSVSMPDSNTIAIGARQNNGRFPSSKSGHVRIYKWNGSKWIQKGLDIDGESNLDESGYAVSMPDANTVAIGAPFNYNLNQTSGHVRIYYWSNNTWVQKGIDIDGKLDRGEFGKSVSMPDANTVAIGAPGNTNSSLDGRKAGVVRVYNWNGLTWSQIGADIDGDTIDDWSGVSVSMPDAGTVAVGATGNYSGHVKVYTLGKSGLSEFGKSTEFIVFPNPTKNMIQILADISYLGMYYSILDNASKVVLTGQINSDKSIIDLSKLTSGCYFLHLVGQPRIIKFIKD